MANPHGHTTDNGARAGRRHGLREPARNSKPPIPRPTAFLPPPPRPRANNHGLARRVNPGASLSSDGPDIVGSAPRGACGRCGCADSGGPSPDAASCGRRGDTLRRSRSDPGRNDCKSAPAGDKGRTGRNDRRRRHPDGARPRCFRQRIDASRVRRHHVPAIVLRRGVGRGAEATGQVRSAPRLIPWSTATLARAARICLRSRLAQTSSTHHPRVVPMGPQGPPVPSASLRADRAALRGRVPPMDYRDNPSCSPKMFPPPNRRGSSPPSTP